MSSGDLPPIPPAPRREPDPDGRRLVVRTFWVAWVIFAIWVWVEAVQWIRDDDPGPAGVVYEQLEDDLEPFSKSLTADLAVTHFAFGIFTAEDGFVRLDPTDQIPNVPGTAFGWALKLDTARAGVEWEERFTAPGNADNWQIDGVDVDLSADGTTATTVESAEGTLLHHFWYVAEGDADGPHRMEISVDGVSVTEIEFRLVTPPESPAWDET